MTGHRRGIGLTPMETRRDVIVRTAALADGLGYELFAVPEGWGLDSAPVLAEIALHTTRIQLASGVLSVWGRTPATLAMTAATLDQISGGRYVLGLGVSTRALAEGFHDTPFEHPARKLRDVVTQVRALLAGQPGQLHRASAARPLHLGQPRLPTFPSGSPRSAITPPRWLPNSATAGSPHSWPATVSPAGLPSSPGCATPPHRTRRLSPWLPGLSRSRHRRDPPATRPALAQH